MPIPDPESIIAFVSSKDLGEWLQANHSIESDLWVKIFKKGTGIPNLRSF